SGRHPSLVVADAFVVEQLAQLALLEHLAHDVATAHELTLDVELRDRRPLRERLDAFADAHVFQHVHILVVDPHVAEDLRHLGGETALGKILGPLHEHNHVVAGDGLADPVLHGLLAHKASFHGSVWLAPPTQATMTMRWLKAGCGSTVAQSQSCGAAVVKAKACSTPPMRPCNASYTILCCCTRVLPANSRAMTCAA